MDTYGVLIKPLGHTADLVYISVQAETLVEAIASALESVEGEAVSARKHGEQVNDTTH